MHGRGGHGRGSRASEQRTSMRVQSLEALPRRARDRRRHRSCSIASVDWSPAVTRSSRFVAPLRESSKDASSIASRARFEQRLECHSHVVELDRVLLLRRAAELAETHRRHARSMRCTSGRRGAAGADDGLPIVTFDRRMAAAARSFGWRVLSGMSSVDQTVAAIESGELVVIPTDTVYGLACRPDREEAVRALSALKGRSADQPIALVAASVDALLELIPELPASRAPARSLHARPCQSRATALVADRSASRHDRRPRSRVERGRRRASRRGSAWSPRRARTSTATPDPRRLDEVPAEILERVAAVLDGGELPGTPSTVIDLTGLEPRVLREGAVPAAEALARIAE